MILSLPPVALSTVSAKLLSQPSGPNGMRQSTSPSVQLTCALAAGAPISAANSKKVPSRENRFIASSGFHRFFVDMPSAPRAPTTLRDCANFCAPRMAMSMNVPSRSVAPSEGMTAHRGAMRVGVDGEYGWGGRVRTSAWRNQSPLPYHLATPHHDAKHGPPASNARRQMMPHPEAPPRSWLAAAGASSACNRLPKRGGPYSVRSGPATGPGGAPTPLRARRDRRCRPCGVAGSGRRAPPDRGLDIAVAVPYSSPRRRRGRVA